MEQFYLSNVARYNKLVKAAEEVRPYADASTVASANTEGVDLTVCARIRPLREQDIADGFPCAIYPRSGEGALEIYDLYNHPRGVPTLKTASYKTDRVYESTLDTSTIYHDLVGSLVSFAWDGGVGTLFAYGQTGSGKTFTTNQIQEFVVETLFGHGPQADREVYLTIVDLAGNSAQDLLSSQKPISLLEDSSGHVQLVGAAEVLVESREEAMNHINNAATYRRSAPTAKNEESSRSHTICRIRIRDAATATDGYLYLIDLAGSEAARDVAVHSAERMREAREINLSLSVLKDCIRSRAESEAIIFSAKSSSAAQKKPHVPFRRSALTKILKHVFDPAETQACKTVIIACVNPGLADVSASRNTLRYAELVRDKLARSFSAAKANPDAPLSWTNDQAKEWIRKNCGSPLIDPDLLAPVETGLQLLRLPSAEFIRRCLRSEDVDAKQAQQFQRLLWRTRTTAQGGGLVATKRPNPSRQNNTVLKSTPNQTQDGEVWYSIEPDPIRRQLPFQDRIRPGMVVRLARDSVCKDGGNALVMVLSPIMRLENAALRGTERLSSDQRPQAYTCGAVVQSQAPGPVELNPWQTSIVTRDLMIEEVIMQYDRAEKVYKVEGSI